MSFALQAIGSYVAILPRGYSRAASAAVPARKNAFSDQRFTALRPGAPAGRTLSAVLADLDRRTASLQGSIEALTLSPNAPPGQRSVASSDPGTVTAGATNGAPLRTYRITVDQLATARTTSSTRQIADERIDLPAGTHAMTLEVDGVDYRLNVTITDTDTNREVLERIARAISAAGAEVQATVQEGQRPVVSRLSQNLYETTVALSVRATGTGTAFSLTDCGTGTLVEHLDLDRVTAPAGQARYSLDSTAATASDNTVTIATAGLTIELHAPTAQPVTLQVRESSAAAAADVRRLIAEYNGYVGWLARQRQAIDPGLEAELFRRLEMHARDLQSIGFDLRDSSRIAPPDWLEDSISGSAAADILLGDNGFFTDVANLLGTVRSRGVRSYARPIESTSLTGLSLYA